MSKKHLNLIKLQFIARPTFQRSFMIFLFFKVISVQVLYTFATITTNIMITIIKTATAATTTTIIPVSYE